MQRVDVGLDGQNTISASKVATISVTVTETATADESELRIEVWDRIGQGSDRGGQTFPLGKV